MAESDDVELTGGGFRDGAVMSLPLSEREVSIGYNSGPARCQALYRRSDPPRRTQAGYIAFEYVPAVAR